MKKTGTVYYRTRKFEGYGKLSHKNLDDLRSGGRSLLVTGEDEKEDPLDFVFGNRKRRENLPGNLRGVRAVRDGILNARRCLKNTSENKLIFMPAERI